MSTTNNRSITPKPTIPSIQISNIPLSELDLYLEIGELLVSKGYPAPTRYNKEIRTCVSCKDVYLIVEKTSSKIMCGYCKNHQHMSQLEKLKIN